MTERIHYASHPLELEQRTYANFASRFKPHGLWWSVGDSWERWCRDEDFNLDGLRYRHRVELNGARILHLSSATEVYGFRNEYQADDDCGHGIRWDEVASLYDGIEIDPYDRSLPYSQHGMIWYYGWDCSSGCVWNLAGVTAKEM